MPGGPYPLLAKRCFPGAYGSGGLELRRSPDAGSPVSGKTRSRQLVSVGGNLSPKLWTQAPIVCVPEGHECRMNPTVSYNGCKG
jgi:hypothetical protein